MLYGMSTWMKKCISSDTETCNFFLWIDSVLLEVSKLGLSYLQGIQRH